MNTLLSLLAFAFFPVWHWVDGGYCITDSDLDSSSLVSDVRAMVSGSDSGSVKLRSRLSLPYGSSDDVVVVATDSICHQALLGLGVTDSTETAYVLRVGTSAYVVMFPPGPVGGHRLPLDGVYFYTLDSSFVMKGMAAR